MSKAYSNIIPTGGFSNAAKSKRQDYDFYMTDPVSIDILKHFENIHKNVWENAAGLSHLADRLISFGHNVKQTDLIVRNNNISELNFLEYDSMFDGKFIGDIVTNPPFKHFNEFVIKSHEACTGKVIMFGPLNCTATQTKFYNVFKKFSLKKIITFSHRLSCSSNGNFKGGNAMQFAWFIFDRNYNGDIIFTIVGNHYDLAKRTMDYV